MLGSTRAASSTTAIASTIPTSGGRYSGSRRRSHGDYDLREIATSGRLRPQAAVFWLKEAKTLWSPANLSPVGLLPLRAFEKSASASFA